MNSVVCGVYCEVTPRSLCGVLSRSVFPRQGYGLPAIVCRYAAPCARHTRRGRGV